MTRRRRTAPPAPRAWIYAVPLPTTRRQRRPGAAPPAPRTRAPAGSTPLPSDSRVPFFRIFIFLEFYFSMRAT
ncbi:Os01g0349600 [Oryza sativa Japonica Group]|uniref:Os01g0349600 protein n=1 Tax=Oryza sativa subsp. japonica TaxID=39947 RepID=A0A0P0V279_ORYSJ|nr:hypothetical protein EE612_002445 [Oryza sativa]BAS72022.1 Os01g0349600 [Oryza sativa Japonica Group]